MLLMVLLLVANRKSGFFVFFGFYPVQSQALFLE